MWTNLSYNVCSSYLRAYHCSFLWWSISCVSRTELRDAHLAGKTLFLGMCVRVFLEEINIWNSSLSPTLVGITRCIEGLNRTKRYRRAKLPSAWAGTSMSPARGLWHSQFSGLGLWLGLKSSASWFSGLHIQTELHHQLSWFSSL